MAVFWALAARQAERLIGIVSISILARVLSPSDFGLVAMASVAVAVVEILAMFGFDWALVRIPDAGKSHYDTAWTLRFLSGVLIFLAISGLSYPTAWYFGRPELSAMMLIMAANSLVGSLENIGVVDYRKYARFDLEFRLRLTAKLAGFVTAVSVALVFRTYWALVLGMTASRVAATAMSYRMHPFRPSFSLKERAQLLSFSAWMLLGNVADTLASRFVDLWIGKYLGPKSVGIFSLSSEISVLATSEFAAPINRTVFARYSEIANKVEKLKVAYLGVAGIIWYLGVPASLGIIACAEDIVALLLGPKWNEAGVVLQVLAGAGLLKVMAANTHYVYWALGRARFVSNLQFVSAAIFVVLTMVFGAAQGIEGVAMAQLLASASVLLMNFIVLARTLKLGIGDLWHVGRRCVIASLAMLGIVMVVRNSMINNFEEPLLLRLIFCVLAGLTVYPSVLFILWLAAGKPNGVESKSLAILIGAAKKYFPRYSGYG